LNFIPLTELSTSTYSVLRLGPTAGGLETVAPRGWHGSQGSSLAFDSDTRDDANAAAIAKVKNLSDMWGGGSKPVIIFEVENGGVKINYNDQVTG